MLTHPCVDQLKQLKIFGMAEALAEQNQDSNVKRLSFDERLGFLLQREVTMRANKQLKSLLAKAKLRYSHACMEDIAYGPQRKLDKQIIAKLSICDWIKESANVIITGATGTGKSWLGCALGHKACLLGFKVRYWKLSRLLEELMLGKTDGRYLRLVATLAKIDLLILDDWGMVKLKVEQQQALLDVLDDRYQQKATIITSQLPTRHWHEQQADPTFADAILDRALSNSYCLEISGDSMRRNGHKKAK
jgi:DNA replication protein DnaC